MSVVELEMVTAGDLDTVRRRLGNSGHIRRSMGDVLDESARIGEMLAKENAPKGRRMGIVKAISHVLANVGETGGLEAAVGATRADSKGLSIGAEGDQVSYPFYVHEGTGLFGALGRLIRPRRAKAMRWYGRTGLIFAKTTRGQRPQPYIRQAFEELTEHYIPQRLELMVRRILDTDR